MIVLIWVLIGSSSMVVGQSEKELDVFYSDCSRYENDLFGGPVCGTDGITYRNGVHLSCLSHHHRKRGGRGVEVNSHGSCPGDVDTSGCPWNPIYKPVCGTDGKTYCNIEWLICCNNKSQENIDIERGGECHHRDPCVEENQRGPKVCASNGYTYSSAEAVRCLRHHRSDLEILHEGGCTVDEVSSRYPSRSKVCEISRIRHEYNPVCGPRNTTYGNPFIFLCSKPLSVASFSSGACGCKLQRACRRAADLDQKYEECRKDTDFPEVCGTDGLTYRSEDHLICAARNNSQLRVLHKGACTIEDSPCLRCKDLEKSTEVCGSDGITYASFVALSCVARSRDPSLHFVHNGICINRRPRMIE